MAERMVYHVNCGCEVYRIMHFKPNLYRIQYCPLHLFAPTVYLALEAIINSETIMDKDNFNNALEALAKAGGK